MKLFNRVCIPFIIFISSTICSGQSRQADAPNFRDTDLPLEQRVDDLVGRLSLDEKVKQMLYNSPAIERLGIPAYNWWNEGLHGVARAGRATVFPQAIGLAATWDTKLMRRVATAISDEARAKHNESLRKGRHGIYEGLTFWSPNINLFRDPRWGRGMETYGEDPYLTGRMAVEFVKGMQGDDPVYLKTIATPKHFAVHSGPEPDRHTFNAVVDERDLRDTYLPQFRDAVVEGHAQSVMCAYNRFRGSPCCGSNELLQKILRNEWGFTGYVVSDCWAIMDFYNMHRVVKSIPEAAAMALSAGTDLNCGVSYDSLAVAVRTGLVRESLVDESVKRLFRARFRLGMFDPAERVPYTKIPFTTVESKEHEALAVEAARKSIVLLKNEGKILPLRRGTSIAVIGPNARDKEVSLGNYNGVPSRSVEPAQGLIERVHGGRNYARGCDIAEGVPSFEGVSRRVLVSEERHVGLTARYYNNNNLYGDPAATSIEEPIDFNWRDAPAPGVTTDTFSVRWSGLLTPEVSGRYALGLRAFGACRLYLDDTLFVECWSDHEDATVWKYVRLTAGTERKIRIEYRHIRPDARIKLIWSPPGDHLIREALDVARSADVVVAFLGLSPRLEGEELRLSVPGFSGGDRTDLGLPSTQEALLESLAATRKPVVLVLLNGSALAVNRAQEHVPAILEAWYPGEAAGDAIADVLFGRYNPSGRLPVTFYRSVDQLPAFNDYTMKGRTYRYFSGEPLYQFGYGLSYTKFRYGNLRVPGRVRSGENLTVSVDVENTGDMDGEEVVQLYVTDTEASVEVPIRALKGFERVEIPRRGKRTVRFTLGPRELSLIDASGKRIEESGWFEISVCGGAPQNRGTRTDFVSGKFQVTGPSLEIPEK